MLFNCSSSQIHMESMTYMDEYWVRGFFLLVPHEEQEPLPFPVDESTIKTLGLKNAPIPH